MRTRIITAALILAGLVWVPAGTTASDAGPAECVTPSGVHRIVFSASKYPERAPPLPGRASARLASAAGSQPSRGGCSARASADGHPDA